MLGHPSPAVHDHFELNVARDRARPLHCATAKFAFVIIFDRADVHLLGQECHAQNPLVWVDRHVASRLFADWVEAKLLVRDETCQKVSGFRTERLLHFGRVDERKAEGDAFDPSLTIEMPDVCQEAVAVENFSDSRLQYLVGTCRAWIFGNDDHAYLPRLIRYDP